MSSSCVGIFNTDDITLKINGVPDVARFMLGKKIQFTQSSEPMSGFAHAYGAHEEFKAQG